MKKLLTMLAMCIILCCALVLSVSAATSVTDDGSNVTLGECTIANLDGAEEISYIQYTLPQNNAQDTFGSSVLNIVSIDRACPAPVVSASYTGKED